MDGPAQLCRQRQAVVRSVSLVNRPKSPPVSGFTTVVECKFPAVVRMTVWPCSRRADIMAQLGCDWLMVAARIFPNILLEP